MKNKAVVRSFAALTCGLLALTAASANGSDYTHPTPVSSVAATWTPNLVVTAGEPKPVAHAITEAGSEMVVGGKFEQVENAKRTSQYDRTNVFAFSATTGDVDTNFSPNLDGDVWSVLSDGTSVYIGGGFTTVNGVLRPALAKVSLATGLLDPDFKPTFTGGRVSDMEMHDGQLIVAGTFTRRLIALNATTGKPTSYIPNIVGGRLANSNSAQVFKFDISSDGQHLVAVGNFTTVDGIARPRVFMLDLGPTQSTLSAWHYSTFGLNCSSTRKNAIAYVQDVDFAPDSSYFALASFGYMFQSGQRGYQTCDSVSRFDTANLAPTKPTWINYTGGDSLKSVVVTGSAIYVQGHSRWLDNPFGQDFKGPGAVDRLGGGAVDPVTGHSLSWAPIDGMPQQAGGYGIIATAAGVWFVTDGARFGGKYHRGIRFAPLP
jgi:hypothetical protein